MHEAFVQAIDNLRANKLRSFLTLLGVILADKGEYSSAPDQMRTYLDSAPNAPDADNVKSMVVKLEELTAKKQEQQ